MSRTSRRLGHKSQQRKIKRKPHHHLMLVTYTGLQPGTDYHLRVAGINSVGQVKLLKRNYSSYVSNSIRVELMRLLLLAMISFVCGCFLHAQETFMTINYIFVSVFFSPSVGC